MGSRWTTRLDDSQFPSDCAGLQSLFPKAHLVFFTQRIRRGGLRLFFQTAVFVLVVLLLLPRTSWRYRSLLNWSSAKSQDAGRLRVVVFGSQDLLGSSPGVRGQGATWTEQLCKELNCHSYLSFVPEAGSRRALTSDALYANELDALEQRMNTTDLAEPPALNYEFAFEQYPVPGQTPDLEAQIQQFLSLPPDPIASRNTLWVMSFGTWDIWNLAALPLEMGENVVDAIVSRLFAQVDVLYRKALDPTSIAYSDFWSGASKSDIERLAGANVTAKVDERELESFRLVVPTLFDVTLAPGWQRRPEPPTPHNKAEQMRNAASLTKRWNSKTVEELGRWMAKGRARPEAMDEEGIEEAIEVTRAGSVSEYVLTALRPRGGRNDDAKVEEGVIYTPYPRRAGLQTNSAAMVLDAMTEEEMQRSHLRDSLGRGTWAVDSRLRFLDIWNPCLRPGKAGVAGVEMSLSGEACSNPDDHLFHDDFTVGRRAMREVARMTAERVSSELFVPGREQRR
ncbi:hypothetical protein HRG_007866 [Hirsutella rhossiliensis]|uniref:Uncharacterized protein n=1 Tax=Hirsutella rhossiliensis TaxID=111463 RepID=A0A9P8MRS1_9HYPO|nr:uncharacterized protein HRG_07866 [Hirsutella rhossiliensis]KAH0960713.1 hypothetical protein HRG_07866 [Hirsutella rhossiliensis]